MADGLYVSMCGAAARAEQLDAVADNLANAQTPGFKPARPAFESFLAASGAPDKVYPAAVAGGFDLSPGLRVRTDRPLDVLPEEGAFLQVRLPDGSTGYTRDGRLQIDASRHLTAAGRPVLDKAGNPIAIPENETPVVDARGDVLVRDLPVGSLALWKLSGPANRVGTALLAPGDGGRADPVAVAVHSGEIETGQALEAAVSLISLQRGFDAAMQAIQTYRRMDDRSTELGRVR
ncbi:MAG: flagellar hook basal-body protein [Deltaproteobacteria bacterium]|nr:flagellar hook basal-body protein [Deltaproteobacteria bacterium]